MQICSIPAYWSDHITVFSLILLQLSEEFDRNPTGIRCVMTEKSKSEVFFLEVKFSGTLKTHHVVLNCL